MLETVHAPDSFPDWITFGRMFNDLTNWDSQKVHNKCLVHAKEVATYAGRFRPGCWCFCGPGSERAGHALKNDHLTSLQTVNGTNSLTG